MSKTSQQMLAEMHIREKILDFISTELHRMGSGKTSLDQKKVLNLAFGCHAISVKMRQDITEACAEDDVIEAAVKEATRTYDEDQMREVVYGTAIGPDWN